MEREIGLRRICVRPENAISSNAPNNIRKIIDIFSFSNQQKSISDFADSFKYFKFDLEKGHTLQFLALVDSRLTIWEFVHNNFVNIFQSDYERIYSVALHYDKINNYLTFAVSTDSSYGYQNTLKYFNATSGNLIHVKKYPSKILFLEFNQEHLFILLLNSLVIFNTKERTTLISIKNSISSLASPLFSCYNRWSAIVESVDSYYLHQSLCLNTCSSSASSSFNGASNGENNSKTDFKNPILCSCTEEDTKARNSVIIFDYVKLLLETDKINPEPIDLHDYSENIVIANFYPFPKTRSNIGHLQFDQTGRILFVSSEDNCEFRIFQILNHPIESLQTLVQCLYILQRGKTPCLLRNVVFTQDSRWLTVTTNNGTVHLYAINAYGSRVSSRTHLSSRPINQMLPQRSSQTINKNIKSLLLNGRKGEMNTGIIREFLSNSVNTIFNNLQNPRIPNSCFETIRLNGKVRLRPMLKDQSLYSSLQNKMPLISLTKSILSDKSLENGQTCIYHTQDEYRQTILTKLKNNDLRGISLGSFFPIENQQTSFKDKDHQESFNLSIFVVTMDMHVIQYRLKIFSEGPSDLDNDDFSIQLDEESQIQWNLNVETYGNPVNLENNRNIMEDSFMIHSSDKVPSFIQHQPPSSHPLGPSWLREVELKINDCLPFKNSQFIMEPRESQESGKGTRITDYLADIQVQSNAKRFIKHKKSLRKNSTISNHLSASYNADSNLLDPSNAIEIVSSKMRMTPSECNPRTSSGGKNSFQTTSIKIRSLSNDSFRISMTSINSQHNTNLTSNSISSLGDSFSSKSFDEIITTSIAEAMIEEPRRRKSSSSSNSFGSRCQQYPYNFPLTTPIVQGNSVDGSSSDISELQFCPDDFVETSSCFFVDPDEFEELKLTN